MAKNQTKRALLVTCTCSQEIRGLRWSKRTVMNQCLCQRILENKSSLENKWSLCFTSLHLFHFYSILISIVSTSFLVYSKSEYTTRISQYVRPVGRLHDNSSILHPIKLKFCTQNCLINISVEFEDENDPSRNGWVIEKIAIIHPTIHEGGYRDFFSKKIFFSELFKTYMNRLSFLSWFRICY